TASSTRCGCPAASGRRNPRPRCCTSPLARARSLAVRDLDGRSAVHACVESSLARHMPTLFVFKGEAEAEEIERAVDQVALAGLELLLEPASIPTPLRSMDRRPYTWPPPRSAVRACSRARLGSCRRTSARG